MQAMKPNLILAWALSAAACSSADPDPGVADLGPRDSGTDAGLNASDGGAEPDGGGPVDTGIVGAPFDLTGAWTSRIVNSQCFDGTLGKDTVQVTTVSLIGVTQNGTSADTTTTVCEVLLTPYRGNLTTYPPAAVAAVVIPPQTSALSGTTIGATYVPQRRVSLLGWSTTNDPATDVVPTQDTDPRVFDADNDGNPGVTFLVDGTISGEVYIANRNIVDISAVVLSNDRIEGSSRTVQEQKVLDADPALLRFNSLSAAPNPHGPSSSFTMVRLPGGVTDCAGILAMKDALLGPAPAVTPCP
jgi:hypothetical protein